MYSTVYEPCTSSSWKQGLEVDLKLERLVAKHYAEMMVDAPNVRRSTDGYVTN